MKVERPRARSSAAPTRLNRRSMMPICALRAGTKEPDCASTTMSAFCRRNVDLPAILGPVTTRIRVPSLDLPMIADEACAVSAPQILFDYGVAPVFDIEHERAIDLGTLIVLLDRQLGKAGIVVEIG